MNSPFHSTRLAWSVMLLLLVWAVYQTLHGCPQLPERVAIHFNVSGQADNWTERTWACRIFLGGFAVMALFFGGLALLLPRLPTSLINLPAKDYWLAPERREQTRASLTRSLLWLGNLTLLLMIVEEHSVFRVNLSGRQLSGALFWLPVVFYMAAVLLLVIKLLLEFRRPTGSR